MAQIVHVAHVAILNLGETEYRVVYNQPHSLKNRTFRKSRGNLSSRLGRSEVNTFAQKVLYAFLRGRLNYVIGTTPLVISDIGGKLHEN